MPEGSWHLDDGTAISFIRNDDGAIGTGERDGANLRVVLTQPPQGVLTVSWKVGEYGSTYSGAGRRSGNELFIVLENHPAPSQMQAFHASQTLPSSEE